MVLREYIVAAVLGCSLVEASGCDRASSGAQEQDADEITMSAMPGGRGWHIAFVGFRGVPSDLVVRFGEERTETYRAPAFELPREIEGATEIWLLEYKLGGEVHRGPQRFYFDPEKAQNSATKDAFDRVRNQWVTWKRFAGSDLLLLSFLNMYSCGIERVEYGFGEEPDRELPLQKCGGDSASTFSDLKFQVDERSHVVLRVTFADGTKSTIQRFPNPNYQTGAVGTAVMNRALVMPTTGGAKVHVDGDYRCDSPCEVKVPVDGREHEIRLKKDGYQDLVTSWKPASVAESLPSLGSMVRAP